MTDLMESFPSLAYEARYGGFVKLKLAHAQGFSLILPDLLIIAFNGWRWFQPKYFSACNLSFLDEGGYAQWNVEPVPGVKLLVAITRDRLVRSYPDGSFLYRCHIAGPARLKAHATGTGFLDSK